MIRALLLGGSLFVVGVVLFVSCSGTIDTGPRDSGGGGLCAEECPEGQVCHEGSCVDPGEACEGVTCPDGQQCYLGTCISGDPCDGVVCPNPGEECQHGVCISGDADDDLDGVVARDDCDDSDAQVHPGAPERCNGIDDDCDGAIDETFDEDGDGFPGCEETPDELRDCDDGDAWIRPGATERCNGADDDCDGEVDEDNPEAGEACGESRGACEPGTTRCVDGELQCVGDIGPQPEVCNGADDDCNDAVDDGDADASCSALPHGTVACVGGSCHLSGCDADWADINGAEADGCETELDSYRNACVNATDLGSITDSGESVEVTGTIAPAGDVDWVTFVANDGADGGCDTFHVDIRFLDNPGDGYRFEVRRGECGSGAECSDAALSIYEYYTDFRSNGDWGAEIRGECPCAADPRSGQNECSDNGSAYQIRVYRPDGAAATDYYRLRIMNG